MAKKTSVGLVVITNLPSMGIVAVLQRRGTWNSEKGKPESWPGGCQVTAHGKIEGDESIAAALYREAKEELGPDFAREVLRERPLTEVGRSDGEELAITYTARVEAPLLARIRLGPSSGGLSFVTPEDVAKVDDLRTYDRVIGVADLRTIAMFDDEKRAVTSAFSHFGV